MTDKIKTEPPWLRFVKRHRAWLIVGITVLLVFAVRVRLRSMPLERDEGEYAYAGQLMLQGIPPYKLAFNMKMPGTYAAYAVIMAIFGQTPSGIHFGLALVNVASIVMMFLLGRKLLDDLTGAIAAMTYGLLSLNPSVFGLAAHATHFVVLPALGGILLLLKACDFKPGSCASAATDQANSWFRQRLIRLFLAGLLFGTAFLMKQHGVFFGVFGGIYLLWSLIAPDGNETSDRRRRRGARSRDTKVSPATTLAALGSYAAGCILPFVGVCLLLWAAGVFPQFWFWTVSYASKYATAVPVSYSADVLKTALDVVIGPSLLFWILAMAGLMWIWWENRWDSTKDGWGYRSSGGTSRSEAGSGRSGNRREAAVSYPRLFVVLFLICSFASTSAGFHYRNHYFITLFPALALLVGLAFSRSVYLLKHARTLELFLAFPAVILLAIAVFWNFLGNGAVWFAMAPSLAEAQVYKTSAYEDSAVIADFLKSNTPKDAKIAVFGSEPQIYFLSHRHSATGYIYTYGLVELQSYAAQMQEEMISQIETNRPEYVVYVNDGLSWLPRVGSSHRIFDWWENYWPTQFELIRTINIRERHVESILDKTPELNAAYNVDGSQKNFLIFKRKTGS